MKHYLLLIMFFAFCSTNINAQCPENKNPGVHVVQKGETLYRIADTYDITVSRLLKWNKLEYGTPLSLCQELYVDAFAVPAGGAVESTKGSTKSTSAIKRILDKEVEVKEEQRVKEYNSGPGKRLTQSGKKQGGNRHVVQPGETMAMLADLYGYTEKRFRDLNAMNSVVEITAGSMILSSDCTCDRINYKEDNGELGFDNGDKKEWELGDGGSTEVRPAEFNKEEERKRPSTSTAPTANGSTAMTNVELTMVDEINLMRSNPAGYVRYVEAYVADQKANDGWPIDQSVVNELIRDLRKSAVLSNLQPLSCIYTAAQKHGEDLKNIGSVEHQGSDGLWPWDRVLNACSGLKDGNENLVGGPESVRESVIILLIDEGIPGRGHRVTMMRPDWKYVACHKIGTIGDMPNCWVQKFGY